MAQGTVTLHIFDTPNGKHEAFLLPTPDGATFGQPGVEYPVEVRDAGDNWEVVVTAPKAAFVAPGESAPVPQPAPDQAQTPQAVLEPVQLAPDAARGLESPAPETDAAEEPPPTGWGRLGAQEG